MSAKNAETLPRPDTRAPGSLTGRLTRHYVISTSGLLIVAAGFLYWALDRSLGAQDRAHVVSKALVMQLLLREYSDKPEVIANEVEHEASENQPMRYFLRILDDRGQTLVETSGMKQLLPVEAFPAAAPEEATQSGGEGLPIREYGSFFIAAVRADTGFGAGQVRVLQVAHDVSPREAMLADYRWKLLTVLGVGVALAGATGAWIARRGLQPLARMAEATQKVTASQLHARVSELHWPVELTALAQAFDAMLDRLEDSFSRLSNLSGDMAHALRNPINILRGEAEVALGRARSPQEYQQVLGSSLEELERLSRMIDSLLFIARSDDAAVALKRVSFGARRELDAVKEFYEALAAETRVEVVCAGDAMISGDPVLVRRAISNLLANALKHTPAGGRVTITARAADGGGAEISVHDNGHGIPPELLPRIFERFFQVDPSRDLTAKGSGLGLAIVQSIMRLHGGEVSVESTLGRGTTVTLRFPAGAESVKV